MLSWKPVWSVEMTMKKIVEWFIQYRKDEAPFRCMEEQVEEFLYV